MIKIDKKIKMPTPEKGRKAKYPWSEMKIGDSFFIEGGKKGKLLAAGSSWAKRNKRKIKFSIRSINGGTRIWRIK